MKIRIFKVPTNQKWANMWMGYCYRCDTYWQYWAFGATLGYGLEHQRRSCL